VRNKNYFWGIIEGRRRRREEKRKGEQKSYRG
jgi:hypothetical protein